MMLVVALKMLFVLLGGWDLPEADMSTRPDRTPAMDCWISCFHVCLIPEAPGA